ASPASHPQPPHPGRSTRQNPPEPLRHFLLHPTAPQSLHTHLVTPFCLRHRRVRLSHPSLAKSPARDVSTHFSYEIAASATSRTLSTRITPLKKTTCGPPSLNTCRS